MVYPERGALHEMEPWRGASSFFSYDTDRASPPIRDVRIDKSVVDAEVRVVLEEVN